MFKKTVCPVCGAQWNEGTYDKCPNCGWVVGTETIKNEEHNESVKESEKTIKDKPNEREDDTFEVNPRAENIADRVAGIILVLGWIIGIILVLLGIFAAGDGEIVSLFISLGGVIYILLSYVIWAFIKMLVNMSRNLFNIKDILKQAKSRE